MVHYTYKTLRGSIPESFIKYYEDKYQETFEGEPGYDGDLNSVATEYICELKEMIRLCLQKYDEHAAMLLGENDEI